MRFRAIVVIGISNGLLLIVRSSAAFLTAFPFGVADDDAAFLFDCLLGVLTFVVTPVFASFIINSVCSLYKLHASSK